MAANEPRPRVVVTDYDYEHLDEIYATLEPLGAVVSAHHAATEAEAIEVSRDADVLLVEYAPISAAVIDALERCRLIVRFGVGYNNIDVAAATRRGIPVCNVPDFGPEEIADHAVLLMLAVARKLVPMANDVQTGTWDVSRYAPIARLRGQTVGIIGLGRTGSLVAERVRAFGMRPIGYHPNRPPEYFAERDVEQVELDDLLARSDVVSIQAALNERTHHLIGERELGLMKPTAILVNTARGGIVDGPALARALRDGQIAGAGLDVVEQEPIRPDDPLLGLPTCLITPHAAFYADESVRDLKQLAADEAARLLKVEPLRCLVNNVS